MFNNQRLEFVKLWWMFIWRLAIIASLVSIKPTVTLIMLAFVATAIIFFGFKKTFLTFPVVRFLLKKPFFVDLRTKTGKITSGKQPPGGTVKKQSSTSAPGKMTGWEPRILDKLPEPTHHVYPRMHGTPGHGLHSSHFDNKSVKAGVTGETNFAKILAKNGMLNKFDSYWSVAMPSEKGMFPDTKFKTDIDCILVSGKNIYLIDVKMYTGGNGTYRPIPGSSENEFALYDNNTGFMVGNVRKPSRNMAMALDRFRSHFPGYSVKAMVVFVPTDRGMAVVPKKTISWHNNIWAHTIDDALKTLFATPGSKQVDNKTLSKIIPLLK